MRAAFEDEKMLLIWNFMENPVDFWWPVNYNKVKEGRRGDIVRTGRPKSANPKNIEVKAKVDASTYQKMMDYCDKYQINKTEFIRKGIELVFQSEEQ